MIFNSSSSIWTPEIVHCSQPEIWNKIADFREAYPHRVHDTCAEQLHEYIELVNPDKSLTKQEIDQLQLDFLDGKPVNEYGNWVHYPWIDSWVRVLEENEFIAVRTDRNRNKITTEEQLQLKEKTIGIVGLSVGRAVATTLAQERVCGRLKLADFDHLELSNLNRIKAPVRDYGVHKTVSVAREILEIDPYFQIEIFNDGLTMNNSELFFGGENQLDLIVDECDSLPIKINIRKEARNRKIAVLMETSDRGMLDIERFDNEPDRPFFHGKIEHLPQGNLSKKSKEELFPYLIAITDFDNVSDRMKQSFAEIGKTLSTWPQLGSAVTLGGGTVTDSCRRIFLENQPKSGRYYVDLTAITND